MGANHQFAGRSVKSIETQRIDRVCDDFGSGRKPLAIGPGHAPVRGEASGTAGRRPNNGAAVGGQGKAALAAVSAGGIAGEGFPGLATIFGNGAVGGQSSAPVANANHHFGLAASISQVARAGESWPGETAFRRRNVHVIVTKAVNVTHAADQMRAGRRTDQRERHGFFETPVLENPSYASAGISGGSVGGAPDAVARAEKNLVGIVRVDRHAARPMRSPASGIGGHGII